MRQKILSHATITDDRWIFSIFSGKVKGGWVYLDYSISSGPWILTLLKGNWLGTGSGAWQFGQIHLHITQTINTTTHQYYTLIINYVRHSLLHPGFKNSKNILEKLSMIFRLNYPFFNGRRQKRNECSFFQQKKKVETDGIKRNTKEFGPCHSFSVAIAT